MVRTSPLLGSLALLAAVANAKEMPVNEEKAARLYDSGKMHESIMSRKKVNPLYFTSSSTYFADPR